MPSASESVAAALEVVSFFLVTIDLYGKERLERLHRLLAIRIDSLKVTPRKSSFEDYFISGYKVIWICCLVGLCAGSGLWHLLNVYAAYFPDASPISLHAAFVLLIGPFALFSLWVMSALFYASLIALSFAAALSSRLLASYKLEGMFILIGSGVFLVGKVIDLFDLLG